MRQRFLHLVMRPPAVGHRGSAAPPVCRSPALRYPSPSPQDRPAAPAAPALGLPALPPALGLLAPPSRRALQPSARGSPPRFALAPGLSHETSPGPNPCRAPGVSTRCGPLTTSSSPSAPGLLPPPDCHGPAAAGAECDGLARRSWMHQYTPQSLYSSENSCRWMATFV